MKRYADLTGNCKNMRIKSLIDNNVNRANILILDEFRMIDKDTIETVLTKFLTASRQPGYLRKAEYAHLSEKERNRQVYLSSAYFQDHWSYTKVRSFAKNMLHPERGWFLCSFPYQLAIKEGLSNRDDIADMMLDEDFSEIKWSINISVLFKPIERKSKRCTVNV